MKPITEQDYQVAADMLNCDLAAIKAVAKKEGSGSGFDEQGRLKILYESHQMFEILKEMKINPVPLAVKNPGLITATWEKNYGKFSEQWPKLEKAAAINHDAAYKACSWGLFQQLGRYHQQCGFDNVDAMVTRYQIGESEHLMGFVRQVKARGLDHALKARDWARFALSYNGKGYKENNYDVDLANYYNQFKQAPI